MSAAAVAEFNGWGYVHLFDAQTLEEIDTFAIPEALDPAFLRTQANPFGFGNLTNHEIATSRHPKLAYLSWYAGGLRVIQYDKSGIQEVGHFIDSGGNDFWGVQTFVDALGRELVAASDRDSGLWIFRYTGEPQP